MLDPRGQTLRCTPPSVTGRGSLVSFTGGRGACSPWPDPPLHYAFCHGQWIYGSLLWRFVVCALAGMLLRTLNAPRQYMYGNSTEAPRLATLAT